jgi:alpha-L-fucosidase
MRSLAPIVICAFGVPIMSITLVHADDTKPFEPTWESLERYECPEWFQDAKFGIYAHWGPYSAAQGDRNTDWYSRNMYRPGHPNHEFHVENFGPISEFGYKDLIPLFTAEKFDADEWVELYVEAGARFAGPVAEHADGFAMWDSDVTKWNAKRMGPKRDVVAEMREAVRKRGLKFVTSLHHQWKWGWYPTWDPNTDTSNPEYSGLYGPKVTPGAWGSKQENGRFDVMRPDPRPTPEFAAEWLAKVKEVITGYEPDLLWFDNRMQTLPESIRMEMASFFYNEAQKRGQEVVLTYKQPDLQEGTATIDLERARMPDIYPDPWLTDSSVSASSWAYASDITYYSTDRLIDDLVDIVSKNGCLLLNVAPRPNGTIPEEQKGRLRAMGKWLKANGEAIYATRPWNVFGEGPTKTLQGHLADLKFDGFTAEDIRFTRSKDGKTLYAIALGWPEEDKDVVIESVNIKGLGGRTIESIRMLGYEGAINWTLTKDGLKVGFPDKKPCKHAFVFRIEME